MLSPDTDFLKGMPIRWRPLRPHAVQHQLWTDKTRFRVVPAGRRSGKTELAKRFLIKRAILAPIERPDYDRWYFFAAAPTREQAKRIYWQDLKALLPKWAILSVSESQLMIKLVTGVEIWVIGMDKPERVEGSPWDGGILDEYGNMKATAWTMNVRPSLSDRQGWCWLIGVPEGRNHYYNVYRAALEDDTGQWGVYEWMSADILAPEEIAAAKRDLDELSFQQEYEGSFVNFTGLAYYPWNEKYHLGALSYNPEAPLSFCFDFNVSPGVAVVAQEMNLPNGTRGTGVIGEVYIPQNSNTPMVCTKLINDWGQHKGIVECFGDATGGAKGTAKVLGSDWDLISQILGGHFQRRVRMEVPKANPAERVRVNSVNSRLRSMEGVVRLMIDPKKAPNLVRDFEGVRLVEGGSGEIDKNEDPTLTHMTDAFGYYIVRRFPIVKLVGTQQEFRL